MGVGAYGAGMFHLFTHAFFKALLFLGAGSVIHAVHHEQDMRKMGGLRNAHPVHLGDDGDRHAGADRLSLHRRLLLQGRHHRGRLCRATQPVAGYGFVLTVVAALMTSFYSWRLIFLTFHGSRGSSREVMEHVHEPPWIMLVPLGILALRRAVRRLRSSSTSSSARTQARFWRGIARRPMRGEAASRRADPGDARCRRSLMVVGFAVAWYFYLATRSCPPASPSASAWLYRFLLNKWYFDELYDFLFVRRRQVARPLPVEEGRRLVIDGFGPDGVSARVIDVTNRVVRLQSGYLYHYAFAMLIGVALLVT